MVCAPTRPLSPTPHFYLQVQAVPFYLRNLAHTVQIDISGGVRLVVYNTVRVRTKKCVVGGIANFLDMTTCEWTDNLQCSVVGGNIDCGSPGAPTTPVRSTSLVPPRRLHSLRSFLITSHHTPFLSLWLTPQTVLFIAILPLP